VAQRYRPTKNAADRTKKKLKRLIERSQCFEIIYAQHVERDGELLFEEVCERNLEGIVCKRKSNIYAEHGKLDFGKRKTSPAAHHPLDDLEIGS
jgi:ATP-dependent DNA ligase